MEEFLKLCLYVQVIDAKQQIDKFLSKSQVNPQQDDFDEAQNPEATGANNDSKANVRGQKSFENVSFLHFLMYFHKIESLDHLVMKALLPSKQIKVSHLLAMYGHVHLMQQSISQIEVYETTLENVKHPKTQIESQ